MANLIINLRDLVGFRLQLTILAVLLNHNMAICQTVVSINPRGEMDTVQTATHKTIYIHDATYNRTSKITTAIAPAQPDILNNSFSYNGNTVSSNNAFPVHGSIQNASASVIANCAVGYYLSTDATLSSNDVFLDDSVFASFPANATVNYSNFLLTTPANTSAGNYYLICKADFNNTIAESNENNNIIYLPLTVQSCTPFSVAAAFGNPGGCPTSANINVVAIGGTGSYTYAFDQTQQWQTSPFLGTVTTNGLYTIYAKDALGCISSSTININWLCPVPTVVAAFSTSQSSNTASFTNQSQGATSYQWSFGDGNGSTAANPSHTYANNGSYTVKLKAINGTLSDSTAQQVNIIQPNCNASLQIQSDTTPNLISWSNPLVFSVVNPSQFNSFTWNNNAGYSSSATIYTPGSYYVIATDLNGCTYQSSILIAENQCNNPPYTALLVNGNSANGTPMTVCLGTITTLGLSNSAQYYQWYKDSTVINGANASTYNAVTSGNYYCVLSNGNANSGNICYMGTFSNQTIAVHPSTTIQFTSSQTQLPLQTNVSFVSSYTGSPSPIYYWTFGDGQTSSIVNPTHTYTTPGIYTVCLSVTNGCDSAMVCKVDTIMINYPIPATPIGLTANGVSPTQIELTWTHNGQNVQNFLVQRSLSPSFTVVDSFVLSASLPYSFADTGLIPCTEYYYRILAKNYTVQSPWSPTATDTTLALPGVASLSATSYWLCVGDIDTFSVSTNVPNAIYQWYLNGALQAATSAFFIHQPIFNNDTVYCKVIAPTSSCFMPQVITTNFIVLTLAAAPPAQAIQMSGDTLFAPTFWSGWGVTYQWFLNGQELFGETDTILIPTVAGVYFVKLTNNAGCSSVTPSFNWSPLSVNEVREIDECIIVMPNPTTGLLEIRFNCPTLGMSIELTDAKGVTLFRTLLKENINTYKITSLANKADGVYFVTFGFAGKTISRKVVKKE